MGEHHAEHDVSLSSASLLSASERRRRWAIRLLWLCFALLASGYCAWRFAGPSPIETNLLALLPASDVNPIVDQSVDRLTATMGDRAVFLVSSGDASVSKSAAQRFGTALSASQAFASVTAKLPPFDIGQIGDFYLPFRFGLLTQTDRHALTSGQASLSDQLTRRLLSPMTLGPTTQLSDDPFGWLQNWLGGVPLSSADLTLEDGFLVTHQGQKTSVLVIAQLKGSAYDPTVQHTVGDAVATSWKALSAQTGGLELARTGAVFYAQAARTAAEGEAHRIGLVSLAGIALLMLWIFRSPRLLFLGFLSTALGIVGALAVTMLLFGKLHLLTLVFGASLIGEAVDYSIQYFVMYLGADQTWAPRRSARAVRPALSVALATSLLGYAILAGVPFPALKQIACFSMVGIATAFLSVISLLPTLLIRPPKRQPTRLLKQAAWLLGVWHGAMGGRRAWSVCAVILIIAIPGCLRLSGDDDVHLLIQRDRALVAQEKQIRQAVGIDESSQFFIVQGPSPEAVLQRSEVLNTVLKGLQGSDRLAAWQSLSDFVPSAQQQDQDRAVLRRQFVDDASGLRNTLSHAGFRDEVIDAWLLAYRNASRADAPDLTLAQWLHAPWSLPYRHLWLGRLDRAVGSAGGAGSAGKADAGGTYVAAVLLQGVTEHNTAALIRAAQRAPGVTFVDKAGSVSALFSAYRHDSSLWLGGVSILVFGLLIWRYGVQGGVTLMAPVILAIVLTLALFGYARMPLNLFHCLAFMLVMGVGANYGVFLREGYTREPDALGATWLGVLLSAATTLLSFGMLALSTTPALSSFGLTLAVGIGTAVLLAPIGLPPTYRRER